MTIYSHQQKETGVSKSPYDSTLGGYLIR